MYEQPPNAIGKECRELRLKLQRCYYLSGLLKLEASIFLVLLRFWAGHSD